MRKLFVSDVDGTLLKNSKPVHPKVVRAISDFVERGNYFALSTGRASTSVLFLLNQLRINAPCILYSGALIYDYQAEDALSISYMSYEIYDLLSDILSFYKDISVTVYTEKELFNLRTNHTLLTKGVYEDWNAPLTHLQAIRDPLIKVLFASDDPVLLQRLGVEIIPTTLFDYHSAGTHFYELTAKGVCKGSALSLLRRKLGNDLAVYAAGDAFSDLTMVGQVQAFYVPITAGQEIQKQASSVFPPPEEGGLAEVLDCL